MKKITLPLYALALFVLPLSAQEGAQESMEEEWKEKRNNIALVFGYTHIPEAFGDKDAINVPTIGLDYFYQLSEKWKLGSVFDVELGSYKIEFDGEEISREVAIVSGIVAGYELLSGWEILAGPGIEFEKDKNIFIIRTTMEYEFKLGRDWRLFPSLNYDFKQEFSSYSLNIGISKHF